MLRNLLKILASSKTLLLSLCNVFKNLNYDVFYICHNFVVKFDKIRLSDKGLGLILLSDFLQLAVLAI